MFESYEKEYYAQDEANETENLPCFVGCPVGALDKGVGEGCENNGGCNGFHLSSDLSVFFVTGFYADSRASVQAGLAAFV